MYKQADKNLQVLVMKNILGDVQMDNTILVIKKYADIPIIIEDQKIEELLISFACYQKLQKKHLLDYVSIFFVKNFFVKIQQVEINKFL